MSSARARTATRRAGWWDDVLGALNATASILPFVLGYGSIAYGLLGAGVAPLGLAASAVAVVLGGAAMATLGASRMPAACPTASVCVVLSGALKPLVSDPEVAASTSGGVALVFAASAAVVLMSGCLVMLLGALRAGSLVRFVPQPVLAGLMNGVAVLIVLSQLPSLLGLPAGALARDSAEALLSAWRGSELLIALATAALMATLARRWPRSPAPLLALIVAGTAAWLLPLDAPLTGLGQAGLGHAGLGHAGAGYAGVGHAGAELAGAGQAPGRIGPLTSGWPTIGASALLLDAATWGRLASHLRELGLGALVLALIGSLESVLNLATVQHEVGEPADPNRELIALGAANLVSGAFGGLPVVYMRTRALATLRGGGRGPRSLWIGSGLMAFALTVGLEPIGRLSTAAVAGVVTVLALGLVDRWSRDLVRRWWAGDNRDDLSASLGIVLLVAAVVIFWSVAAGLAVGLAVSATAFMRTLHRQLVRARYTAAEFPSRRVYADADEAVLAPLRAHIRIVELEGALFFGSAERLADEADRAARGAADVVLDLRRVTTIDASGALALVQAGDHLQRLGVRLRLAGVRPNDRRDRMLRSHGATSVDRRWPHEGRAPHEGQGPHEEREPDDGRAPHQGRSPHDAATSGEGLRLHPDIDRAVESAELHALDRAAPGHAARRVALEECQLLRGLAPEQLARLAPLFSERRLAAGERLFREGETGLALYVLSEGAISVVEARNGQRFATLAPGMCFGETALLDGAPRTADAVADVGSTVHALTKEAIDGLQQSAPEIAAQLYANMARHLSGRLRSASAGWRRAAE